MKNIFIFQFYGIVGRSADIVMVNGTWTEEHINRIWKVPLNTHRVYPPCEVSYFKISKINLTLTLTGF